MHRPCVFQGFCVFFFEEVLKFIPPNKNSLHCHRLKYMLHEPWTWLIGINTFLGPCRAETIMSVLCAKCCLASDVEVRSGRVELVMKTASVCRTFMIKMLDIFMPLKFDTHWLKYLTSELIELLSVCWQGKWVDQNSHWTCPQVLGSSFSLSCWFDSPFSGQTCWNCDQSNRPRKINL